MARISNPLIGRSANKIGNVVLSTWKGINVMKEKPASVANPRTDGQVSQRSAFAQMVALARLILATLQITFRQQAIKMSAYNAFVKANLTEAFTISGGTATFVPANLVVSKGTLPGFLDLETDTLSGRAGGITFSDNSDEFGASASDRVGVVVVAANGENAYAFLSENTRADGELDFTVPGSWSLTGARVCPFFVNAAGSKSSDSVNLPL